MNPVKQADGWADRILRELKASPIWSKRAPYAFLTSCVDAKEEDINKMQEDAEECTFGEMQHNCDFLPFMKVLGYIEADLALEEDWHVSYARSMYKGSTCYYLVHSAIEYIWVNKQSWEAEKLPPRLL